MKFSTVLTVCAMALCVAGCKYDKAAKGGSGSDVGAASASDISTTESEASEMSLAGASEGKFEDLYGKFTGERLIQSNTANNTAGNKHTGNGSKRTADTCSAKQT